MSSVDGRIDCAMTAEIDKTDAYYEALDRLQLDAVLEGRISRQMHYALPESFMANDKTPIGEEKYCIAHAMIGGGIDGRAGMAAVFDGIKDKNYPPTLLTLNEVERMGNTVWLRYTVDK